MTGMKRTLKVIMIMVMLIGLTLSILNLISIENQARPNIGFTTGDPVGTTVEVPGGTDCQGAPLDC